LALIFNTSDGTLGRPVKGASRISTDAEIREGAGFLSLAASEFGFVTVVDDLEFSGGEVSEFVQFNFPGVVAKVVGFNEGHVGLEDTVFVEKFLWGIGFVELHHPVDEVILVNGFRNSG